LAHDHDNTLSTNILITAAIMHCLSQRSLGHDQITHCLSGPSLAPNPVSNIKIKHFKTVDKGKGPETCYSSTYKPEALYIQLVGMG